MRLKKALFFDLLNNPLEIIGEDAKVSGMKVIEMELGEPDASGRRRPVEIPGSEKVIDADTVIIAIGQTPNPLLTDATPNLELNKWNCLQVNEETMETTVPNVYAGGDAVTGAATVILAMGAGKKAAKAMYNKLILNQ